MPRSRRGIAAGCGRCWVPGVARLAVGPGPLLLSGVVLAVMATILSYGTNRGRKNWGQATFFIAANKPETVGWVERSDTHLVESTQTHVSERFPSSSGHEVVVSNWQMGVAALDPSYEALILTIVVSTSLCECHSGLTAVTQPGGCPGSFGPDHSPAGCQARRNGVAHMPMMVWKLSPRMPATPTSAVVGGGAR